jgi:DNA repair ATPase RecN
MPRSPDEPFDRLEALIERGFAAVAQDVGEVKARVGTLRSKTQELRSDMKDIRGKLRGVRDSLEALETKVWSTAGFAKEINYLFSNYVSKGDNVRARSRTASENWRNIAA